MDFHEQLSHTLGGNVVEPLTPRNADGLAADHADRLRLCLPLAPQDLCLSIVDVPRRRTQVAAGVIDDRLGKET